MKRGEQGGIFFRMLFLLFFLGLVAVVYFARFPLMRFAAETWVIDEPAAPSDALVVLGDDNYAGDRAFHAADLYREGVARTVVASGRMLRQNLSIADVMEHDLESFGVAPNAIVKISTRAQNTREEAVEVAKLVQARGWKRVTIVTSSYHARRARFIYSRTFPSSVSFRVSGARDSEFDPARWWETRLGQKLFFSELAGYAVARWELRTSPSVGHETWILTAGLSPRESNSYDRGTCLALLPPVPVWKQARAAMFAPAASTYYIAQVTVLSGLLFSNPASWPRSFRFGG